MARSVSVFVISSFVVSGQVGLKAMMPALRALQLETVSLPTTILSAHPAAFPNQGPPVSTPQTPEQMLAAADWLLAAGALDDCAAVITGYLPSTAHIAAARRLKPAHLVVTSAPAPPERIATLSVADHVLRCETACAPQAPHGMGYCFAALYVGLYLKGEAKALGIACASLAQMANQNMQTAQLPHGPVVLAQPALTDKLADKPTG